MKSELYTVARQDLQFDLVKEIREENGNTAHVLRLHTPHTRISRLDSKTLPVTRFCFLCLSDLISFLLKKFAIMKMSLINSSCV